MSDLYKEAARIIQRANLKEGSLKTLVYGSSSHSNLRQLFFLVSECIKYQCVLKDVLIKCDSNFLNEELIDNDRELALVFLYEVVIGKEFGRNGFLRQSMRKYKAGMKTAFQSVLKEKNVSSITELVKGADSKTKGIPRYARVNLIKTSVEDATNKLTEEGWEYIGKLSIDKFQEDAASLTNAQFGLDPLLQDVLVFPAQTDLHNYHLVTSGILVLQNRASCVPAHVLHPREGSTVLDCCAAPGNKTSHLASLMGDKGQIIALDRDAKRMATMKTLLQRSGAVNVETIVQDFLTLSPHSADVSGIDAILVDPSCSGSGMSGSRPDEKVNSRRLETLKRFQISLLKHALRFPAVQTVVYSTCSIHAQENEEVVEEVMGNVNKYFDFIPVFPDWPDSRGLPQFEHHQCFLRLSPEKHLTTGFFVACFGRKKAPKSKDETDKDACSDDVSDRQVSCSHSQDSRSVEGHKNKTNSETQEEVNNYNAETKKEKRKKKLDTMCENGNNESLPEETHHSIEAKGSKEKKKKKKNHKNDKEEIVTEDNQDSEKDKKVKRESINVHEIEVSDNRKKLHKRKKRNENLECSKAEEFGEVEIIDSLPTEISSTSTSRKRKRSKQANNDEEDVISVMASNGGENTEETVTAEESPPKKKKKHKKDKKKTNCDDTYLEDVNVNVIEVENAEEKISPKKRKKSKKKHKQGRDDEEL